MTFAGDESGDVSFSFDRGASRYFVFALLATSQPDEVRQALADLRGQRNLPAQFEFKFHKLSAAALRQAVFTLLSTLNFQATVLYVDKHTLPDSFRVMTGQMFYAFFVSEIVRLVPGVEREGATLLLDQFDPTGRAVRELKRTLKRRQIRRGFKRIVHVRSRSESLVQAADLVAGAVLRNVERGEKTCEDIQDKIRLLYEFRP
jgi:hypothetical protein